MHDQKEYKTKCPLTVKNRTRKNSFGIINENTNAQVCSSSPIDRIFLISIIMPAQEY